MNKYCFLLLIVFFLLFGHNNAAAQLTLQEAFKSHFLIGGALNGSQFSGQDKRGAAIAIAQFNTISPENALKWGPIHPEPDKYNFEPADRYVEFGVKNNMFIIGHTLVWHAQTPKWVFEDEKGQQISKEKLLARMRDHIMTVVGRYKGKIKGWDVVNEALNEDGSLRQSPWMKIIGEEYLAKAFQYAHEADPDAELYYNDFSLENEPKRNGAVALIKKLQLQGVRVTAIGTQQHIKMDWPTMGQVDSTIKAFAALGVQVNVTELDVDVLPAASRNFGADISLNFELQEQLNPYKNGLPDSVQQALAKRYADLFAVFVKNGTAISRITFWGVTDGDSWLNNWPVRGRTSYPLLFDRDGKPKPAFDAVVETVIKR